MFQLDFLRLNLILINFFRESSLIRKLLNNSNINETDVVLDIGAGTGMISKELATKCKKVVAIEYDPQLANILRKNLIGNNIEIIQKDFLSIDLPLYDYKVFSNIPFNMTSRIINKLYFTSHSPMESYLVMQKEAANKYMGIGEGKMISLLFKPFYDIEVVHKFSSTDFTPVPAVQPVFLRIQKRELPLIKPENINEYNEFIIYVIFQQKPTIKQRLNKIFTQEQLRRLSKDLLFSLEDTVNDISDEQWLGLYKYYNKGVTLEKKSITIGSLLKYINERDNQKKEYRSRTSARY